MLGVGNADLERLLILLVVAVILVLTVRSFFAGTRLMPQVPPAVSPLLHPIDEDVRGLRHWRANIDQKMPDLTERVVRHEEQIAAVRRDLDEIKHTLKRSEHMLGVLVENGLKEGRG